jgi:hypothetical protein
MNVDLKGLARLGAQARLAELVAETDAILKAFPHLLPQTERSSQRAAAGTVTGQRKRRRYHRMSPAERKAVSQRMKRYWAERRKAK